MGLVGPVMNAAGIGVGIGQAKAEAARQNALAMMEADTMDTEAAYKELQAKEAVEAGRLDQAEEIRRGRGEMADQKAAFAASGVDVNSGSTVEAAADKAAWTEYNRQKIEYAAEHKSWGLQYDAALLRQKADNTRAGAKASGANSVTSSVIKGGIQFGSLFATK